MTLREAIDKRQSRRNYQSLPLNTEVISQLNGLVNKFAKKAELPFSLIEDGSSAFAGLSKSYGLFKNVRSLIALFAPTGDPISKEKLGYFGEILVLEAISLGLDTCWVGGSFDQNDPVFEVPEGHELLCVITLGYAEKSRGFKEKLISKVMHRPERADLYVANTVPPEWFLDGIRAAGRAPSHANKRPAKFSLDKSCVTAYVEDTSGYNLVDLGIAKAHFVIGCGSGYFDFGNHGQFHRE